MCLAAVLQGVSCVRATPQPDAAGVETVMLAAPTAPDERLPRVCARARGFVYAVGLLALAGSTWLTRAAGSRRLLALASRQAPALAAIGITLLGWGIGGLIGGMLDNVLFPAKVPPPPAIT